MLKHLHRLLFEDGSSDAASDVGDSLKYKRMTHVRCALYHPAMCGKIER